jgi:DNA-binding NarL/FixJ family response regulator
LFAQALAAALRAHGFAVDHLSGRALDNHTGPPLRLPSPAQSSPLAARRLAVVIAGKATRDHPDGIEQPTADTISRIVTRLRAAGWTVLLLTELNRTLDTLAAGITAGAVAVRDPTVVTFDELLDTLADAARGQVLMPPAERWRWTSYYRQLTRRRHAVAERLERLSQREAEVLGLLHRGLRPDRIAVECGTSLPTVRSQIRGILTKLEVKSQLEAVAILHEYFLPGINSSIST